MTATAPVEGSHLAAGWAYIAEVSGGLAASPYSVAPALGESLAFGKFFGSSEDDAWSMEIAETGNLVMDHTTPQFGFIGASARHLAKPDAPLLGPPGKTIDFQRLAAGAAFAYDGRQVAVGVGADLSIAYLVRGSHGVSAHLGAYFFGASALTHDSIVMLSIGYVFSPVADRPYVPPPSPIPGRDETKVCRDLSAYRYALAEARKHATEVCQDEQAPECLRTRERIRVLAEGFNSCQLGKDVGPPAMPDAP